MLLRGTKRKFSFTPPGGDLALWRVEADSLQRVTKSKSGNRISNV
jgi:hypothetical protein